MKMRFFLLGMFLAALALVSTGCDDGGASGSTKTWTAAALAEAENSGDASSPQIIIDANDNAMLAWNQNVIPDPDFPLLTRSDILARTLYAEGAWGSTSQVEGEGTASAGAVSLAADEDGNIMTVYMVFGETDTEAYFSYYDNMATTPSWGAWDATSNLIEEDAGDANYPQVAMDPAGNAIAVWQLYTPTDSSIYFNMYDGAGWGSSQTLESSDDDANKPVVAMDPEGNAIVVWKQHDGTSWNLYARRYDAGDETWGVITVVDSASNIDEPQSHGVAIDADGNAFVIFRQWQDIAETTDDHYIFVNRYTASSNTWSGPVAIDAPNAFSEEPRIAMDPDGNAVAVWSQWDGADYYHLYGTRYSSSGQTWSAPALVESFDYDSTYPELAMDVHGNAIVAWLQGSSGGENSVYASTLKSGSARWAEPMLLETSSEEAMDQQVAMDSHGNGIVVWTQSDGTRDSIFYSLFK